MHRTRRKGAGVKTSYKEVSPTTAPSVGSDGRAFPRPPPRPVAKKKNKGQDSQVITVRSPPKAGKAGKAGKKKTPASGTRGQTNGGLDLLAPEWLAFRIELGKQLRERA